ncbi:retrotransposon protein, putative, ty1-copia subclass [Tanacetum coccineum]
MAIRDGKIQKANKKSLKAKGKGKANGKGKDKQVYIPKPKNPKPSANEHLAKDDTFHHCKDVGHWKTNCPVYLAELLKKKKQVGTASSLDYGISVSKNDVLYFNVIPRDGINKIDMYNLVPNVNSIYNVSNKRAKHNLDSTYLCHCRLAHISKKRIKKLQHDGLLKSTNDESFDQCVSCLSGKMTRKPFSYRTKKATDLLGIIRTDVCGPLRHVSRQGASYFITFTDDYSRYGYVYLLKHKHEVFETFKVFKNKVENQLGKTIKALRSDRGGEYISQDFKDYLKACGIVQHLTPPNTPQHNGYPKEIMGYYFYFPPENKIVVARYAEFFEKSLITQEVSGRAIDLEEIQDKDTSRSKITIKIPMEVEGFEPPQEEVIPIQTFSSVADIRAIRNLIAIAAFYDYEIWKMNVKTAFLNGYLDEDIYMVQPEGVVDPKHLRKVCKLQRSIYGLKQASRSWNKRFDEKIKRFGFAQNIDEPCVYQKASGSNVTFLILYVDDIIIMGNHIPSLQSVKDYLGKCFAMKNLGEASFILGIKIYRDRSKRLIGLSQSAYMDKILKRYRIDNSKRGHIPMQERLDLNKTQGASTPEEVKRMQSVPYASVAGSIMYSVRCTRPDVAFAQNITSPFQQILVNLIGLM